VATQPDPLRLVEEAAAFSRRLALGLDALRKVGPVELGPTARDVVHREDKLTLYRYRPLTDQRVTPLPLVICYALVNRPDMMDLQEDRSLIRGLLRAGLDVYLVDWGYPDGADRFLELDDYVNRYLVGCVDQTCRSSGAGKVNLLGVCQGGTLSLCHAALHPERIANLVTMVTPVDFQTPENLLAKWARQLDLDTLVAATGNVPGELLNAAFLALMPYRLNSQKYARLLDLIEDPAQLRNFLRMEKWIFDSPDQPGEAFRQFVRWFYQENRLVRGTLRIGGRLVDLGRLSMPILNVYASQDHLVPPSSSLPLEGLVGTRDYSTYVLNGGHIGIYVSAKAQKELPLAIANWLESRS